MIIPYQERTGNYNSYYRRVEPKADYTIPRTNREL